MPFARKICNTEISNDRKQSKEKQNKALTFGHSRRTTPASKILHNTTLLFPLGIHFLAQLLRTLAAEKGHKPSNKRSHTPPVLMQLPCCRSRGGSYEEGETVNYNQGFSFDRD